MTVSGGVDAQGIDAGGRPAPGLADAVVEVARGLVRAASRAAGPGERQGLTGAQFDLLLQVGRSPGCSVAEAASRLGLARNTVSTLVGHLCQAGMLERVADPADGRVARLHLHPRAHERMAAWRARRVDAVATALAALDADGRGRIEAALPVLDRMRLSLEAAPGERSGRVREVER